VECLRIAVPVGVPALAGKCRLKAELQRGALMTICVRHYTSGSRTLSRDRRVTRQSPLRYGIKQLIRPTQKVAALINLVTPHV